jgi:two-component system OmpR family sensor kinase
MTRRASLPIKARLTVAFAASMAVVLGGLGVFVYQRTGSDLLDTINAGLRSRAELLATDIQHRGPALANVQPTLIESDEVFAQIADASGRIVQSSSLISGQRLLPAAAVRSAAAAGKAGYADRRLAGVDGEARVLAVPVMTGRGRFVVMVGAALADRQEELAGLAKAIALAAAAAICLISLGAWLAVTGALRPVERMRRQAAAISAWDPGRRLPVSAGKDELALLGGTLNQMLERIDESVDRERRLVDRASHELRTPLAIQRMDLDLAASGPQTVAELRAALDSVSQENTHLTRLTEDLLVLARARRGRLPIRRADTSLAELLAEAQRRAEMVAGARARVSFAAADAHVRVDPVWFGQAIGNLIDNAVRHTPPGGEVAVRADRRDGMLVLTVDDAGPGFAEAFLGGAFTPFAQTAAGPERGRQSAGLGLAVVQTIANAHGGRAWAENLPGGGARVTIATSDGTAVTDDHADQLGNPGRDQSGQGAQQDRANLITKILRVLAAAQRGKRHPSSHA